MLLSTVCFKAKNSKHYCEFLNTLRTEKWIAYNLHFEGYCGTSGLGYGFMVQALFSTVKEWSIVRLFHPLVAQLGFYYQTVH